VRNLELESQIFSACGCPIERRDFTNEEIRYILMHHSLQDDLLFWFESTLSDGCWTEEAVRFMRSF
jgi:hypothetical protein